MISYNPLKIGAFGTGNLGDDLILKAILLKEPNANIVAYGAPLLPNEIHYIDNDDFVANSERYIKMASSLDFGGGGLFWSEEHLINMLILAQQAKLAGIPVMLNRVSLQGYHYNKRYAEILLNTVDVVTVRDGYSLKIARDLGCDRAEYLRDYAFDLLDNYSVPAGKDRPSRRRRVAINFSDTQFTSINPNDKGFVGHIAGIFSELSKLFIDEFEFFYVPFCMHRTHRIEDDLKAAAILSDASGGLITFYDGIRNADDLVDAINSVDVVIGRRFHMQVLGHGLGKLVIPMAPDVWENSKFTSLANDMRVMPIPYAGVSRDFTISLLQRRLKDYLSLHE